MVPPQEATVQSKIRKPRRKRLTVDQREVHRHEVEESKWRAAKTPEAKAWVNPTRLLKEVFGRQSEHEDVLALKVGLATRQELCFRSESMGLNAEIFDVPATPDGIAENWVFIGKNSMTVAGKLRDIQRQSKRSAQKAQDEAKQDQEQRHDEVETREAVGLTVEVEREGNIDPRIRELDENQPSLKSGDMGMPVQVPRPDDVGSHIELQPYANMGQSNPETFLRIATPTVSDETPIQGQQRPATHQESHTEVSQEPSDQAYDLPRSSRDTQNNREPDPSRDDQRGETSQAQIPRSEGHEHVTKPTIPHEAKSKQQQQDHDSEDGADPDRTANWVQQHSKTFRNPEEPEPLDPTGKWKITSEGIKEAYGATHSDFTMNIHISKTRPQSDNDTSDGNEDPNAPDQDFLDNLHDEDIDDDDADLTPVQKSRSGTYQMWATFDFGLYTGILRFMNGSHRSGGKSYTRKDFDLQEKDLPSLANKTFQYKWRGRETGDLPDINPEADQVTQWVRFEGDGSGLSGVFEGEFLGENAFSGVKVGRAEEVATHLGRLWSEVSPKAHKYETRHKK